MTRPLRWLMALVAFATSAAAYAAPSVYPTGTTIYDPAKTWNGYTVLSSLSAQAVIVIDMNGNVVKRWDDYNDSAGGPARILPGGVVVAAAGARPRHQESLELVQRDFDGKILWQFNHSEEIETPDGKKAWSVRQHHDWQRDDFPAGYYSPATTPKLTGAKTLILTHTSHENAAVAPGTLEDDRLIEVSWDGKVLWQWVASDHIDELGFGADARAAIKAGAGANPARNAFDWLHTNSATYVGPNHWFDEGDKRFAPDNVIVSSRQASLLAIVARDGHIVWRIGPDFSESEALRKIRQIIGQHNAHFIPKGLPGAGDLLVFDNGGASGYGAPTPVAPNGQGIYARANSRVLEINPVTLELVWSYVSPAQFYSSNISGAQRLPNGNTLITEGAPGRMFEVTTDGKIVWEYMSPFFGTAGPRPSNAVYRAYRLPYDWIPQLPRPKEHAVTPPALADFKLQ
jgi:hypothetical protein